ncbi:MAG: ABC transporter substrate-binding protein [Anaerolineae bacterium]|nr:ABC transporter substrate-binding protein [Anaerolineae bacterium]
MESHSHHARSRARLIQLLIIAVIITAAVIAAFMLGSENDGDNESQDLTPVTLYMSFIPSVQFSPVYVAAERGYFKDEGIAISLEHSLNEADGVERIASNNLQFGLISGEQVVLGRGKNRPLVYVFEWFHSFPVGIVSPVDADITEPADLAGRVVGMPGPFGASYIGLRALLKAADLTEDDLGELFSIGFTAPETVCEGTVEAAVVYIVNEPLTIEQDCTPVNVIKVSDYVTLVSNGLVTNETTIREQPDLVRGMVRALKRGVEAVLADPDAAFDIAVKNYVTDLPEDQYVTQRRVLENSLGLWRSDNLGLTDPAAWDATQTILIETGLLDAPLDDLSAAYDMDFLPES